MVCVKYHSLAVPILSSTLYASIIISLKYCLTPEFILDTISNLFVFRSNAPFPSPMVFAFCGRTFKTFSTIIRNRIFTVSA